mmetsp:Transcript_103/g.213  ORF Transcript_103/g.213 Transcript_103/m.213 type:complete len:395 (-) Transcript_103:49-1233(-)
MRRALAISYRTSRRKVSRRTFCSAATPPEQNSPSNNNKHPATPAPSDADASKEPFIEHKKVWLNVDKKPIFPWRHETEPLERLVDPNISGGVIGPGFRPMPWWIKQLFTLTSAVHLNVPWYQVLTTSSWKQELADAAGFAFSQAVAGVLSNRYKVPFQTIVSEDGTIDFSTVTEKTDENETTDTVETEAENNEKDDETSPEIDYMMEKKLRKLYEASHDFGKDQMKIVLQTEPVHCELVSLLFIPYITRQAVNDAPSLKHSFRNMSRQVEKKRLDSETGQPINFVQLVREAFRIFEEYANSRARFNPDEGYAEMESTVIAQVLITCDEVFSVTDVATGMIMQGNGKQQRVFHLVRLEVPVKEHISQDGGKPLFEIGSWQIVDWDDLEDGNIWFI